MFFHDNFGSWKAVCFVIELWNNADRIISIWTTWLIVLFRLTACTFYSTSEYPAADTDSGKFVRIKEDHPVGEEIFAIDVYPRSVPVCRQVEKLNREWNFLILVVFFCVTFSFVLINRKSVELRGIERSSKDDKYFRIREVNSSRIQIVLKESLDDLVDSDTPHNILKFKIQCNSAVQNRRNHDVSWDYES